MNYLKNKWVWILILVLVAGLFFMARDFFSFYYPLPRAGTGAVIGKLDLGSENDRRYTAQDLFLARPIDIGQPNLPPVVAFSYSSDPHTAAYDSSGRFAFTDVPPGKYALLIWHPGLSFVIESPDGGAILVEVEANKTINLGTIVPQQ